MARRAYRSFSGLAFLTVLVVGLALALVAWLATAPRGTDHPRVVAPADGLVAPPLDHQVYVWQRRWDDAVISAARDAVSGPADPGGQTPRLPAGSTSPVASEQSSPAAGSTAPVNAPAERPGVGFTRLVVLAAELRFSGGRIERVDVDVPFGRLIDREVGLAVRVGAFGGPFETTGRVYQSIAQAVDHAIARARAQGVEPVELQIDFDAAESKLEGYAVWLRALRERVSPVPLTVTALPSWMGSGGGLSPGFREVVAAVDGFVMQVHSLDRPATIDQPVTLCDPQAAARAIDRAATAGKPFRAALPTYGYTLAFRPDGRFFALAAENAPDWPGDVRLKRVTADAGAMAQLIRRWSGDRPAALRGVIWYRLPVESDRLNWSMPTLRSVAKGVVPTADDRFELVETRPGLVEVRWINAGTDDASPQKLRVTWGPAASPLAFDGLAGWLASESGNSLTLTPAGNASPLAPGESRTLAWLRFEMPTTTRIDVVDSPGRAQREDRPDQP